MLKAVLTMVGKGMHGVMAAHSNGMQVSRLSEITTSLLKTLFDQVLILFC
jgi:hypothetical protein